MGQKAEVGLVRKIISSLTCQFYDPGQILIAMNRMVDGVHFIFEGFCKLTSTYHIEGQEFGFSLRLPTGSWYGDYQVLMDTPSTWNLMTAGGSKTGQVKIMTIAASSFKRYTDEYP